MTKLEAKKNLNVLNDKKWERVERMDEWMRNVRRTPIYRFVRDLLEEMCL